jgi:lycopene beta-cyclase
MTYFGFLAQFVGLPILVLVTLLLVTRQRGHKLPDRLRTWPAWAIVAGHVLIALIYTTPWDNYLVATRVWWYDPDLVTGIVLGWVPIEEYTFFVVQTILTGLWLLWLAHFRFLVPQAEFQPAPRIRWRATAITGVVWVGSLVLLFSGWRPGTYLALELSWALFPILIQFGFGADILWHYRRLVLAALVPTTLYLSIGDAIAIESGTWTINPEQSLNWLLGGVLPIEEFLFFLLTNTLVVFGVTLMLARESHVRANLAQPATQKTQKHRA